VCVCTQEEDWTRELSFHSSKGGKEPGIIRVVRCVKDYVVNFAKDRRSPSDDDNGDSIVEREIPYTEHESPVSIASQQQESSERVPASLPYMYLRSMSIVPAESRRNNHSENSTTSNVAISRELSEEQGHISLQLGLANDPGIGDPTMLRKVDSESSRIWDYSWSKICANQEDGSPSSILASRIMPMFKPILLHSACFSRNIMTMNAFYHNDHIASVCKIRTSIPASKIRKIG
jgi:hypothetical protein